MPTTTLWILGVLVKGTAVLLVAFALAAAAHRASAGLRHLLWSGAIAAVLALPLVSLVLPWKLPLVSLPATAADRGSLPPVQWADDAALTGQTTDPAAIDPGVRDARGEAATSPADSPAPARGSTLLESAAATPVRYRPDVAGVVLIVWITGLGIVLGRLGLGALLVGRLVRRAARLATADWRRPLYEAADRLGLHRPPQLVASERARMPFVTGLARPTIVLPAEAAQWNDRRRRAVLSHELAHIRRRDLALNVLSQLACALYWFHPLVWVAARRLRIESERACDDLVLGAGTRPSEYADHLLQIVCRTASARTPAIALPMAQRREFEGRMLAILEPAARRGEPSRRHAALLAAASFALIVPLAALGAASGDWEHQDAAHEIGLPADSSATRHSGGPDSSDRVPTPGSREGPAAVDSQAATAVDREGTGDRDREIATAADGQAATAADRRVGTADDRLVATADDGRVGSAGDRQSQDTTSRVVLALIRALQDSVESVRKDAAYALGRREATDAVAPLGDRVLRDPSAEVREMAVWALTEIGRREAVTPIAAALIEDASEEVRATAAWALGQIEDPAAVTALAAALGDQSHEVRGRAAWALGQIEPTPAPAPLIAALADSSAEVRQFAAWALGQIEDPAAAPALLQLARSDGDHEARKAAIWALGRMDGAVATDAVISLLEHQDPEVRAAAARYLAGGRSHPWPWPWPMPRIR